MNGRKLVTFSYDDGITTDKRLVEIFNFYKMKCTFNLNSGIMTKDSTWECRGKPVRRMDSEEIGDMYSSHEIAMHFLTHPHPFELSDEELEREISEDIKLLSKRFGQKIVGSAYPYGEYDERIISALKRNGIKYARTVNSTHEFSIGTNFLELNPTCHHNDEKLMELAQRFVEEKSENAALFYVWGHSYEFDGYDNWDVIIKLCEYLSKQNGIIPCTNAQALGI